MNKIYFTLLSLLLYCVLTSWGFYAHKKINETATYLLSSELAHYYKQNIKLIREKAVDADKRCYVDSLEPVKHYIDIDKIDNTIDSIPIHWSKAKEKYSERKLLAQGIVPWQISRSYQNLVEAFKSRDSEKIIRYSADLGHYVADAHVPLHTTSNYNGQYTDQIGIHAFWETRLPEMFASQYNLIIGPAIYIHSPLDKAWEVVKTSNSLVDSVLSIEKNLSKKFKQTDIKSYIERNNQLTLNYSDSYATAYHNALNGMVERRFRASIHTVASLWYSAWIDAGQPKLTNLKTSSEVKIKDLEKLPAIKPLGREEWH